METTGDKERQSEVWFLQRVVRQYRLPVWDRLIDRLGPDWRLRVFGNLDKSDTDVMSNRPYVEHLAQQSIPGGYYWPGILGRIRREGPSVVIAEANPRNPTAWLLPGRIRAAGGKAIVWTKGHRDVSKAESRVSDLLRRRLVKGFDAVITYGRTSQSELVSQGIPLNRVFVAQNTIDTDRIFDETSSLIEGGRRLRAEHGLEERRILLYPGTMFRKKRHLDLIEAWPILRDSFPDLVLVMVGGGENLEIIRSRAQSVDPERIILTGRVPEGVDYQWIATCDIAVQCGGLGLAINQCLALAKPLVVADEPGVDGELVVHGETGWRYPAGDVARLAETISHVLSSAEEVGSVAAAGREAVRDRATIGHMVEGFVGAMQYCGLLQEGDST